MDIEQIVALLCSLLACIAVFFFGRWGKKRTDTEEQPSRKVHNTAQEQLDDELEKLGEEIDEIAKKPNSAEDTAHLLRNRRR